MKQITVLNYSGHPINGRGIHLAAGTGPAPGVTTVSEEAFSTAFLAKDGTPSPPMLKYFRSVDGKRPALVVLTTRAIPTLSEEYALTAVRGAVASELEVLRAVHTLEQREAVKKALGSRIAELERPLPSPKAAPVVLPSASEAAPAPALEGEPPHLSANLRPQPAVEAQPKFVLEPSAHPEGATSKAEPVVAPEPSKAEPKHEEKASSKPSRRER